MEENKEIEGEILFYKFDNDPDNYHENEKNFHCNEIWQFIQGKSAKIDIQSDKIAYLVPKRNAKIVEDYFSTFIKNFVIDLQEITKEITDPNKIEFFKLNQVLIES